MKTFLTFFITMMMFTDHRIVYVFYTTKGNATKDKQVAEWNKDKAGLKERDIETHIIDVSTNDKETKKWKVDINEPFTFILVGKDGGEKLRAMEVVTNEKLFGTIDKMPMRQSEIKGQ